MEKDCNWIYDQIKESGIKYKVIHECESGVAMAVGKLIITLANVKNGFVYFADGCFNTGFNLEDISSIRISKTDISIYIRGGFVDMKIKE